MLARSQNWPSRYLSSGNNHLNPVPFLIFVDFVIFQAAEICGCVGIIAEVSYEALKKRHDQGWVKEIFDDVDQLLTRVKEAKKKQEVRFEGKTYWISRVVQQNLCWEVMISLGNVLLNCYF